MTELLEMDVRTTQCGFNFFLERHYFKQSNFKPNEWHEDRQQMKNTQDGQPDKKSPNTSRSWETHRHQTTRKTPRDMRQVKISFYRILCVPEKDSRNILKESFLFVHSERIK